MRPNLTAGQLLQKARMDLLLDNPFWGFMAMQLELKEDPSSATLWTDGVSLGYNPKWVESSAGALVVGVLAKLIMHICAGHAWRQSGRNYQTWNQACSFAVNPYLRSAGFVLPESCEIRKDFIDLYAEAIYAKLEEEQEKDPDDTGPPEESPPEGAAHGEPAESSASPSGNPGGGELSTEEQLPAGEIRQGPVGSEEKLREKWKSTMEQAAVSWGDTPLGLSLMAKEGLESQTPWQELLRNVMDQGRSQQDYDWAKPSVDYLYRGLYMPGLVDYGVTHLVAARDTSGSISSEILGLFNSEITAIFQDLRPDRATVLDADCRVTQVQELEEGTAASLEDFSREVRGGGGTSFIPVFEWVASQGRPCACLVYLTDLEGSFPSEPPDYDVIWVVPQVSVREPPAPPFGTVVRIPARQAFE